MCISRILTVSRWVVEGSVVESVVEETPAESSDIGIIVTIIIIVVVVVVIIVVVSSKKKK